MRPFLLCLRKHVVTHRFRKTVYNHFIYNNQHFECTILGPVLMSSIPVHPAMSLRRIPHAFCEGRLNETCALEGTQSRKL